jgi:hypothetical protein
MDAGLANNCNRMMVNPVCKILLIMFIHDQLVLS